MTQTIKTQKQRLRITAVEKPILRDLEESFKIWFTTVGVVPNTQIPRFFGIVNRKKYGFPVHELLRTTNSSTVEDLVGKEITASVIGDGSEITIINIGAYIMQNLNLKEGTNWLQVEECHEGISKTSGNQYWVLKCLVLPNPKSARNNLPLDAFNVYFMKDKDWALQNLQNIILACGAEKPWQLYGKRFIADVVIKNDFVSLRRPRPYTENEEAEAPQLEPAGINAQGEWPW